jgi:hypothetical protein
LAALLDPGDQHRLEVGAGGVDGGAITGGTRTENENVSMFWGRHRIGEKMIESGGPEQELGDRKIPAMDFAGAGTCMEKQQLSAGGL